MRLKNWIVVAGLLTTSGAAIASNTPKGVSDVLGQENLNALIAQTALVKTELAKLDLLLVERQSVINYEKRDHEYRYFEVTPGSFRSQLERFKTRIHVQKVRWDPGVPTSCDWSFDTTFKIDVTNPEKAMKQFFSGLPLNPILLSRDKSLMVYPISYLESCTP